MADRGNRGDRGRGHGDGRGGRGGQHPGSGGGDPVERATRGMAAASLQDRQYHQDPPEKLRSYGDFLRITPRPDNGGTRGTIINLEANHFHFKLEGKVVVQQYEVNLTRFDSNDRAKRVNLEESNMLFWYLVKQNQAIFGSPDQMVYDRKKQMFALKEIPECKSSSGLKLRERSVLKKDDRKNVYFTAEIKHVGVIDVTNVKQTYSENLKERERQQIQFLELLFRQGRLFNDQLVPAGRSFYLRSTDRDRLDLGCGRELLRGFYLATRVVENWQLSLNVNWNATAFYEPINVVDFSAKFLCGKYKQDYDPRKPKPATLPREEVDSLHRELKGIQMKSGHINQTFRPTAIATETARTKKFPWKERDVDHGVVTVEEYYKRRYNLQLRYPDWPLVQRGKGQNVRYMPMELCEIVAGQRVENKELTDMQHRTMVTHTAVTPFERRKNIMEMLKLAKFAEDPRLKQMYISMSMTMARVTGRVLPAPLLQYTNTTVQPSGGQWNGATLFRGARLQNWGFVNFSRSTDNDIRNFAHLLCNEGRRMGMDIQPAYVDDIWQVRSRPGQEKEQTRDILQTVKRAFDEVNMPLQLIIVVLSGSKKDPNGPYSEIKRYSEQELGIMTQCVLNDRVYQVSSQARDGGRKGQQALSNIILKINAKLGGVNVQIARNDPIANKYLYTPILFVGADVTHADKKGDRRTPSIAAVCGNIDNHPNRYRGVELIQPNRKEVIVELKGAIKTLLKSYYVNTGGLKPDKIIFYRDGVSEGQFLEVLTEEERAIEAACTELEESYKPAITFIVVQKRHNTRFFKKDIDPNDKAPIQNIPPGTVVDRGVAHPVEFDFFLCSHQGIQGTSKPSHYHVLFDQSGFTSDELQALTYQLCHTYARCTKSVSIPAPCYYAHHIAYRAKLRTKGYPLGGSSGASSSSGSDGDRMTEEELSQLQQLITITEGMQNSMYWQ